MMIPLAVVAGVVVFWLLLSVKVLNEYERGAVFRLGKVLPQPKGPGLIIVAWPIDRMVRVSLRRRVPARWRTTTSASHEGQGGPGRIERRDAGRFGEPVWAVELVSREDGGAEATLVIGAETGSVDEWQVLTGSSQAR